MLYPLSYGGGAGAIRGSKPRARPPRIRARREDACPLAPERALEARGAPVRADGSAVRRRADRADALRGEGRTGFAPVAVERERVDGEREADEVEVLAGVADAVSAA